MLKPKTALIILYCVLGLLVVALIAQIAIEKEFNTTIAVRALIPMALCASAIVKVMTGGGARIRNTALYEREYDHVLRRAFTEEGRGRYRKRVLDALSYYNRDQYEKAINICDSLLPLCVTSDDFCAVLMVKALSYSDAGLTEGAIDLYLELLRHDQTVSTAWSNLGVIFRRQGKNLDALSCYENAVKYDSLNATAYANLAHVYFAVGHARSCIEMAERALELKANLLQAMSALCCAYTALGDEEACDKYFRMAVQNGYDRDKLKNFLDSIRDGSYTPESLAPTDEAQKDAIREVYRATAIPMLRMGIPAEHGLSRIGGHPLGRAPTNAAGQPMRLLCVLYCSELHGVPDLPETGILQFFISDDERYGLDRTAPTVQRDFCVSYTENEDLPVCADDRACSESFPVKGSYPIQFVPTMCAMTDSDYRFEDTVRGCFEKYHAELTDDMMAETRHRYHAEGHRVGGFPYFVESDPRGEHPELQRYDTLLLQVDTHDGLVEIGNTGVINFFISKEDLRNRNFANVLYWWDDEG